MAFMEKPPAGKVLLDDTVPLTAQIEASQSLHSHTVSGAGRRAGRAAGGGGSGRRGRGGTGERGERGGGVLRLSPAGASPRAARQGPGPGAAGVVRGGETPGAGVAPPGQPGVGNVAVPPCPGLPQRTGSCWAPSARSREAAFPPVAAAAPGCGQSGGSGPAPPTPTRRGLVPSG